MFYCICYLGCFTILLTVMVSDIFTVPSPMVAGAHNGTTFLVKRYEETDIPIILEKFFESLKCL